MYAIGGVVQLYIICYCVQQLLDAVSFVAIHIFTYYKKDKTSVINKNML